MKMTDKMLKLFWYWMRERHLIYKRRQSQKTPNPPWTKDKILQTYKFTNVYRRLDRVSVELERILAKHTGAPIDEVLFNICVFRMFNWPPTYAVLAPRGWLTKWDEKKTVKLLKERAKEHQVFTGAYIITNSGSTRPKIELCCEALTALWKDRQKLAKQICESKSLEKSAELLRQYPMIGAFVAYELVSDLRWTKLLSGAKDIDTWANVGPGADRGLRWLLYGKAKGTPKVGQKKGLELMVHLLDITRKENPTGEPIELREIEHVCCEIDKYLRVKTGAGRPRSKFRPYQGGEK